MAGEENLEQAPNTEQPEAPPEAGPREEDAAGLKKSLEEQSARAEGFLNNWKRAQADLENFRKKSEQERQELATYANAMLVSSLLPVLDDLERAFNTLDASLAGLTWVEGLKLVYRKMFAALESQGLSAINTVGQRFDPKYHEAMMHVPGEEGVVVGELQKGYAFRDRVLRPAMVKVGNGQPAPEPEPSAEEQGD